jgi:DNA-binding NarL/FixJ family response regulator
MDGNELERVWDDLSALPAAWRQGEAAESVWRGLLSDDWQLIDAADDGCMRFLLLRARRSLHRRRTSPGRELDVLARAALGQPGKMIAHQLELSPSHVSTLLRSGLERLGFQTRAELVWFCRTRSDLGPPPNTQVARFRTCQDELAILGFVVRPSSVTAPLTRTEAAIATHVLEGRSNRQVAEVLGRSINTVGNQVARVRAKLCVGSRLELIRSSARWASALTTPSLLPRPLAERFIERTALEPV